MPATMIGSSFDETALRFAAYEAAAYDDRVGLLVAFHEAITDSRAAKV